MEDQLKLFALRVAATKQSPASNGPHKHFDIYVDGAARGNPGAAGAGIYILHQQKPIIKKGIYLGEKTNNQAEYLALALALFFIKDYCSEHHVATPHFSFFSDSELLVKQMRGEYKVKNEILAQLHGFISAQLAHASFRFIHVLREKNKDADQLANLGIDKKNKIPASFIKALSDYGLLIS